MNRRASTCLLLCSGFLTACTGPEVPDIGLDDDMTSDSTGVVSPSDTTTGADTGSYDGDESDASDDTSDTENTDDTSDTEDSSSTGESNPDEGYEDCINDPTAVCPDGGTCIESSSEPLAGVCATEGCTEDDECSPPSDGDATPTCADTFGESGRCVLACDEDTTCPSGMDCFGGMCSWPFDYSYDGCADSQTCDDEDLCIIDNVMEPVFGMCMTPCTTDAECGPLPPGGNANASCADLTGDGNAECYIPCNGGETCPDGTVCFADFVCLVPSEVLGTGSVRFEDDFETADFSAGWTVVDADGLTPNPGITDVVGMVAGDGWTVSNWSIPDFAATTSSWYDSPANSDDWLISPPMTLGAAAQVSWISGSHNDGYPESFELRISTTSPDIDAFLANPPLLTMDPEASGENMHMIDLAAAGYENRPVYLAFHSIGFDGSLLWIDDVLVVD